MKQSIILSTLILFVLYFGVLPNPKEALVKRAAQEESVPDLFSTYIEKNQTDDFEKDLEEGDGDIFDPKKYPNPDKEQRESTEDSLADPTLTDELGLAESYTVGKRIKGENSGNDSDYYDAEDFFTGDFTEPTPTPLGDPERGFAPLNNNSIQTNTTAGTEEIPEPSPSPSPSPSPLIDNDQARGYTILSLMQPQARISSNAMLQNMLDSNLKRLYLGILVDGTFGFDNGYLNRVIEGLNIGERELTLVVYLSNGPTMRDFRTTTSTAAFNQVDPRIFRGLIRSNPATRRQFEDIARRMIPFFAKNIEENDNNKNIAVVMLEDNLDSTSYVAMRDIARGVLQGLVEFYRNPCDCNPGDPGTDIDPQGDRQEVHVPEEIERLRRNDGYSLDGTGYRFDFESGGVRGISEAQVRRDMTRTREQQVAYYGLWRFDRQGLGQGTEADAQVPFSERVYAVPTDRLLDAELELLTFGYESDPE